MIWDRAYERGVSMPGNPNNSQSLAEGIFLLADLCFVDLF